MMANSHLLIDCEKCNDYNYRNWLKFIAITLLPLTVFYVFALLLSCNVTSSSFSGIVFVIQCITAPGIRTYYLFDKGFLKLIISLLEMMHLEFFRHYSQTSVCLHPKLNVFHLMCLEYVVTLYPFLLIFLTYILVTAYDKQYRILVWMWKPFKICVHYYQKTWNIRTSLVQTFATFIFLSFIKISNASLQLLSFTIIHDVADKKLNLIAVMSNGVKYFSPQHLPYALLAIAIGFIFVIVPFFLLGLYPSCCFHKCANSCGLRLLTLHAFMDTIQGSYKLRPHDMRCFSAFYLLLRVVILVHTNIFLSPQTLYISGIILLASAAVVAFFSLTK